MPFLRSWARAAVVVTVPAAAVTLAALGVGACGSSDSGPSTPEKSDASSDASTGTGGAATGGRTGNGGNVIGAGAATGNGGLRGGAAGTSPMDGGGLDAGPGCPPPPKAPDATLSLQGTCTAPAACGGALTGTWVLQSLCASSLFTAVRSICSTATIDLGDQSARGGVAFDATKVAMSLHATATASVTFPNNCSFCQCSVLEAELASAGLPSASCSPVCSNGDCTCTVRDSIDLEGSHPYTVSGNTVSSDSGSSFDYCVGSGKLALADSSSGSGFDYATFATGTAPSEICDGFDNDLNGVVDNDPVECPTCSHAGVCAEGFTATCGGTAGWQCTYTSPKYESPEQSCDGLDNDCNGIVDKLPTCEICDGVDNDNNGVIDDHLTDTPTCPKTGVCVSGTTATCAGKDGWQCQGTAATYELVETKCDGLDNDCDGAVDEACPPCTGMKDMWMAGTTATLDLYRGAATATSGQKILSITGRASKLAVDPIASKIYWVNAALSPPAVQRANFDGTGVETLSATASTGANPGIGGLALDPGKSIYWFDNRGGVLLAALTSVNTPGSGKAIVTGVYASELAVAGGKLYYNDGLKQSLHRSDLDGSNDQTLLSAPVDYFAVDLVGNHIYWLRWFDFASLDIWSTNLDGSGQRLAAQGFQFTDDFYLADFAVDPWQKTLFVASSDYVQKVTVGSITPAALVQWSTNLGAIALSGCAP